MTYYFNLLFFLHIFGIACYAYLYYDVKLIRNENFFKWFQDKAGICKKEDYEHSPKYEENVAYKELFDKTFHKFERKHYNVLVVEPAIYGDRFISVSDKTLNKAQKGNKLKATIKKGLFGARFIEKEEILLK